MCVWFRLSQLNVYNSRLTNFIQRFKAGGPKKLLTWNIILILRCLDDLVLIPGAKQKIQREIPVFELKRNKTCWEPYRMTCLESNRPEESWSGEGIIMLIIIKRVPYSLHGEWDNPNLAEKHHWVLFTFNRVWTNSRPIASLYLFIIVHCVCFICIGWFQVYRFIDYLSVMQHWLHIDPAEQWIMLY